MSKRLWWFLLINNLIILLLFVRKMHADGVLIVSPEMNFQDWKLHTPSSQILVGAAPFVFSFGFILYKIITHSGGAQASPGILDRDSSDQKMDDFIR